MIYSRNEMTWQKFRKFLLEITDDNGIVVKNAQHIARQNKFWRWGEITLTIKKGDKVFNGKSKVHINKVSKQLYEKYQTYDYPSKSAPVYIRDAKEGTLTVVPKGKEKEYLNSQLKMPLDDITIEVCQPGEKSVKHKVERIWTPIVETPKQQIGLIRKFWRWIY